MFQNHRGTKVYLNWLEVLYEPDRASVVQFHSKSCVRKASPKLKISDSVVSFGHLQRCTGFQNFKKTTGISLKIGCPKCLILQCDFWGSFMSEIDTLNMLIRPVYFDDFDFGCELHQKIFCKISMIFMILS